jgi:hypothetical protein
MTLPEKFKAHIGGLVHLKTQLCWHDGRGWDKNPDRVCLIVEAPVKMKYRHFTTSNASTLHGNTVAPLQRQHRDVAFSSSGALTLLLIDGSQSWIWVCEADVELL